MRSRAAIVILGVFLSIAPGVRAETDQPSDKKEEKKAYLYEWVDDRGDFHAADRYDSVPPEYRGKIRKKTELPKHTEGGETKPPSTGSSSRELPIDFNESERVRWRELVIEWKSRLSQAQARLESLKQKQDDITRKWGTPAYAPKDVRIDAEQINEQVKQVEREIEDAGNMLEKTIPEDARKAGVPPGWIREQ